MWEQMDHLVCFLAGTLALGAQTAEDPERAARDMKTAKVRPGARTRGEAGSSSCCTQAGGLGEGGGGSGLSGCSPFGRFEL